MRRERVTSAKSANGVVSPTHPPGLLNLFDRVDTTRGLVTATKSRPRKGVQDRRDNPAVKLKKQA